MEGLKNQPIKCLVNIININNFMQSNFQAIINYA